MNRHLASLAALAVCFSGAAAHADTSISGVVELKFGGYLPQIDAETGIKNRITSGAISQGPYAAAFNNKHILLFQLEYDHEFFQAFGSLSGALSAGYGEIYGKGLLDSTLGASSDNTALKVWPLKLLAVYRFDVLSRRWNVPLVPFLKAGLVYELWRSSNGQGNTSTSGLTTGQGGNWGWEGDLGLAFVLDWLDPNLAKDMDIDLGINHTYFFAEWTDMSPIRSNPFSQPDRIRLNDKFFDFGLAFEF
jgi:hypothetical protein